MKEIKAEKNYNLELIRMISFIFVILIHVTNYYCRAYGEISRGEYIFALILDMLARVSVPCFFMITGALLLGREEPLEKHIRRLWRFFIVLLVWSLIYVVWNNCYMKTSYNIQSIFYEPAEAHLWYLYAMIPIYMVLPFFQIMCKHMDLRMEQAFLVVITAAVISTYLLSFEHEEAYYDLPLVGDKIYSYYVFVGYYIYKYRKHVIRNQRIPLVLFIGCMSVNTIITFVNTVKNGVHCEKFMEYQNPLLALAACMFFMFIIRLKKTEFCPGERTRKIMNLFCSCSFGIYLIHILFLDTYKKHVEAADASAWIVIPGLTFLIVMVSFGCVWLIRRTEIGRKIT